MKNSYKKFKLIAIAAALTLIIVGFVMGPVYSWLTRSGLSVYAPITTTTVLFIGAGNEEGIRYLSFEGLQVC